jgi:acetyl esterase
MPLDPAAQALIDAMDQSFPKLEELDAAEARRLAKEMMPPVDSPEPVASVEDRTVPGPETPIPIRVFRPQGTPPFPGVVFFHGGGWVIGDLDSHDSLCRRMTNEVGAVVVSVDYRLAPETKFPGPAEDAFAATRWVSDHAAELDIDPGRLAVAGDSAGGNLAAVVALMARDRGGPHLGFQLLVYPVTDHRFDTESYDLNGTGYFLTRDDMKWFWRHYLAAPADGDDPYASPLRAPDLGGLPPAMVVTAEYDPLRDEGEAYGRRLQDAGVDTTIHRQDGVFHGFFSFGELLEGALVANAAAFTALRGALGRASGR